MEYFSNYKNMKTKKWENNKKWKKSGLTVIESVVFVAIFTIIMVALISLTVYFYRSNAYSVEQSFAVNGARKGIEMMVADIREATYSDEGAYPVASADAYSFTIYSDIDNDNNIEKIRFFIEGDVFKKGTTKSTGSPLSYNEDDEIISIISSDVRNVDQGIPIFRYYDSNGGEILNYALNITNIAFVKVHLIVNINPNRLPNEFSLKSSATLRNLKTNL